MSGAAEILGRKIAGAQDLAAVVRSMKAIAASSIGQYEQAVESLQDYYRTVELGLSACLRESERLPWVGHQSRGPTGAVIFGSDQGLVGGFNETLSAFAVAELESAPGGVRRVWTVGERMQGLVADAGLVGGQLFSVPSSVDAIGALVGRLLLDIASSRDRGEVVDVLLFHNHPRAGAVYQPEVRRLLPLDALWRGDLRALRWPTSRVPQIMDEPAGALAALIREYLFVLLFQACAQSLASENASRLAAMQRAEKNIGEMVENLRRTYHRIRQESIDEELFEVVSGYEALRLDREFAVL